MNNITISILGNQLFLEIVNEIKLFSEFTIKYYNSLDKLVNERMENNIVIFFPSESNLSDYEKLKEKKLSIILITKHKKLKNITLSDSTEQLTIPFSILTFQKKIISLAARYEYKKSSIINLSGYNINKIERYIKKNEKELQLTEKEIDFLILFSTNNKPLSRDFILKKVWNYSSESDTHTVETHIHRLRKKILEKFGDNNFIKNNEKGYYI